MDRSGEMWLPPYIPESSTVLDTMNHVHQMATVSEIGPTVSQQALADSLASTLSTVMPNPLNQDPLPFPCPLGPRPFPPGSLDHHFDPTTAFPQHNFFPHIPFPNYFGFAGHPEMCRFDPSGLPEDAVGKEQNPHGYGQRMSEDFLFNHISPMFQYPAINNIDMAQFAVKTERKDDTSFPSQSESSSSTVFGQTQQERIPSRQQQDCQVCQSSTANGLHFGARTCAACAAFFRRTISDDKKYACKRSQRCHNPSKDGTGYRKICRACRLKRCMDIGMLPENVQHKRMRHESPMRTSSFEGRGVGEPRPLGFPNVLEEGRSFEQLMFDQHRGFDRSFDQMMYGQLAIGAVNTEQSEATV